MPLDSVEWWNQSREVTTSNLSEVLTSELRLEGLPTMSKFGGTSFQTEKITRARTCVGMSLAISKQQGHPERSFPEINAYSGVMEPKVRHFYDSWYIYSWIVSRMNVIKILCPIVDSSYPWRVGFRGWQDEKRDLKVSIFKQKKVSIFWVIWILSQEYVIFIAWSDLLF